MPQRVALPGAMRRIAFLRAVNAGGHTIRMADLRASFEGLGFESLESNEENLERVIERGLEAAYGYPIETFIRSLAELAEIAARDPFGRIDPANDGRSVFVAFMDRRPTEAAIKRLTALATDDDAFAVVGREAYWLRRGGMGTSKFSSGFLEKTLGVPATLRGLPTVAKIVARYG